MQHPFDACVLHRDGRVEISLFGELDLVGAEVLRERVRDLLACHSAGQVTFNCTALEFIDLRGIGALLELAQQFGGPGRLTLRNLGRQPVRVLEVTRTADVFIVHEHFDRVAEVVAVSDAE